MNDSLSRFLNLPIGNLDVEEMKQFQSMSADSRRSQSPRSPKEVIQPKKRISSKPQIINSSISHSVEESVKYIEQQIL